MSKVEPIEVPSRWTSKHTKRTYNIVRQKDGVYYDDQDRFFSERDLRTDYDPIIEDPDVKATRKAKARAAEWGFTWKDELPASASGALSFR